MRNRFVSGLAALLAIAVLLSLSTVSTRAQDYCNTFQAIGQLIIPTTNPLAPGHRWGGQIYIKMGDEFLLGLISGEDGQVVRKPNLGHGSDGLYIIGFNCTTGSPNWTCTDTINVRVPNSVFGGTAPIFDQFQANSAYFDGGTGRFANATGNTNFRGPYIVWPTGGMPPFNGRFNPEFFGQICGVDY